MRIEHKTVIKLILAIFFALCLLKMPYGYYQFIRFFGMIGFVFLAYIEYEKKVKAIVIIWIISAILINPFIKIPLGRTIWNVVDIVWSIILIISVLTDFYIKKKNK